MLPALLFSLTGIAALSLVPMRPLWAQHVLSPVAMQPTALPPRQAPSHSNVMLLSAALARGTPVTLANFSKIATPDIRQVIGQILAQLNATAGQVRQPLFTIQPTPSPVTRLSSISTTQKPSEAVPTEKDNSTTMSSTRKPTGLPDRQVRRRHSQEGKLRLVGGQTLFEGNVEINHMGYWGSICDDQWDLAEAHVVCRQMGFVLGAVRATSDSRYGKARRLIWMDSVFCTGFEETIQECPFAGWKKHDCGPNEAAGVICRTQKDGEATGEEGGSSIVSPKPTSTLTVTEIANETLESRATESTTSRPSRTASTKPSTSPPPSSSTPTPRLVRSTVKPNGTRRPTTQQRSNGSQIENRPLSALFSRDIKVRLGGEQSHVEVRINGQWQLVCGDGWSLNEAQVVCKQLDMGFAGNVMHLKLSEHEQYLPILGGIKCNGNESQVSQCLMTDTGRFCPDAYDNIAGVTCAPDLPDLVPDAFALESSAFIEDRSILFLQCAMEENCLSRSAYELDKSDPSWIYETRRLLRFTASIRNIGKVDFRPFAPKYQWVWHSCHRHYHSMEVFAHFDLFDQAGKRVAEGHKASFCLEDNLCQEGSPAKYVCANYGDQGISVGCVDIYKYDLDCQWIDISDIDPGDYFLKISINPEYKVPEATFDNNAAMCRFIYTPIGGYVTNCTIVKP